MNSRSDTSSNSETVNTDSRQVVDGRGIAVGSDSTVYIDQVPDELIEMTGEIITNITGRAIDRVGNIAELETRQDRSENAQALDTLMKFGIPAAAVAFVLMRLNNA